MSDVVDNVIDFFHEPMYLQMLRRAESELNAFKAIEGLDGIGENNCLDCMVYGREVHSQMYVGEPEYDKICTIIKVPFYFEEIEEIILFEFRRYFEDYSNLKHLQQDWANTEWKENRFSSILEAHQYNKCTIVENLKDYLDVLFDTGFRLIKNIRIRNNVKRIILNKENVLIVVSIDYDALSEYGETMTLLDSNEEL